MRREQIVVNSEVSIAGGAGTVMNSDFNLLTKMVIAFICQTKHWAKNLLSWLQNELTNGLANGLAYIDYTIIWYKIFEG